MIKRIGTGDSGQPLVLAELNEHEHEALARLVNLAERNLDQMQYPKLRGRRQAAEAMIKALRETFGLPVPPAAGSLFAAVVRSALIAADFPEAAVADSVRPGRPGFRVRETDGEVRVSWANTVPGGFSEDRMRNMLEVALRSAGWDTEGQGEHLVVHTPEGGGERG